MFVLAVDSVQVADTLVVRAIGPLDVNTCDALREEGAQAVASGSPRVVLDLEGVTLIDSAGVAVVVAMHHRLIKLDRQLSVTTNQPHVVTIFELAGLDDVVTIRDSGVR